MCAQENVICYVKDNNADYKKDGKKNRTDEAAENAGFPSPPKIEQGKKNTENINNIE